jgi:hypothetical protein
MNQHAWSTSTPTLTHCIHGLDLRINPRCYLCSPYITASEIVVAERADCGRKVRDVARAIRDTEIPQAIAAERARITKAVIELPGYPDPLRPNSIRCLAVLAIVNPEEADHD